MSTYKKDLVLNSQRQIDDIYHGLITTTKIDGDLRIEGADITDLSALSNIRTIDGSLIVYECNSLQKIEFPELEIVGHIYVQYNDALTDIYMPRLIIIGKKGGLGIREGNDILDFDRMNEFFPRLQKIGFNDNMDAQEYYDEDRFDIFLNS